MTKKDMYFNDFKTNQFAIVDQFEMMKKCMEAEQTTLDEHELKVMELIDRIGELVGESSQEENGLGH